MLCCRSSRASFTEFRWRRKEKHVPEFPMVFYLLHVNGILSIASFFSIEIKLFFDRFYLLKRQLLHSVLYSAAVPSSKLRVPVITLQYLVIIRSAVTFTHLSSSACLTFFGLINFVIFHDRVKLQTNYLQYKRKRAKYTKSAHTSNFQQKLSISTWCLPCQPVRANMFGPKKKI